MYHHLFFYFDLMNILITLYILFLTISTGLKKKYFYFSAKYFTVPGINLTGLTVPRGDIAKVC